MTLARRLAALDTSPVPSWVFDADHFRFRWANAAALELWRAPDAAELLARDFSDMSISTQRRIRSYIDGFRVGRGAEEEWTLYPRGEPVLLRLFFSGVELDDGRLAALIQGYVKEQNESHLVRSVEVLRHTSVAVTLIDLAGAILIQNPASLYTFGPDLPFAERFADPSVAEVLLRRAAAGEVFQAELRVRTLEGERWHAVEARRLTDPATGGGAVLVHETNETTRLGAERLAEEKSRLVDELHGTLAVVERQRQEILALSAPILDVASDTLALPIIGPVDAARSAEIETRLLAAIAARGVATVILDLTGADVREAAGVTYLMRMAQAIALLGARPIVAGVTPALAKLLTAADADFTGVRMVRSLKEGIEVSRRPQWGPSSPARRS